MGLYISVVERLHYLNKVRIPLKLNDFFRPSLQLITLLKSCETFLLLLKKNYAYNLSQLIFHFSESFLFSFSYNLTDFYVPSFDKPDFVCAMPGVPGMQSCNSESIPPLKDLISGRECTLSYEEYLTETKRSNNSNACVNWNKYYSQCRQEGDNPSWGAIGFDNIFIAWVAIFQVGIKI